MCKRMIVFIKANPFRDDCYSNSIVVKIPFPTSSTLEINKFVISGLREIFREHKNYKRVGITLMDFVNTGEYQPDLFLNSNP